MALRDQLPPPQNGQAKSQAYRVPSEERKRSAMAEIMQAAGELMAMCCTPGFYGDLTIKMSFRDGVPDHIETTPRKTSKIKSEG